jgi:hypothetical protein
MTSLTDAALDNRLTTVPLLRIFSTKPSLCISVRTRRAVMALT